MSAEFWISKASKYKLLYSTKFNLQIYKIEIHFVQLKLKKSPHFVYKSRFILGKHITQSCDFL